MNNPTSGHGGSNQPSVTQTSPNPPFGSNYIPTPDHLPGSGNVPPPQSQPAPPSNHNTPPPGYRVVKKKTSRYDFELLGKSKGKKSDPEGSAPRDQPTVPSEDETKESDPSPLEADPSPVKADQDTKTHDGGQGGRGPKKPHRHGNHIQLEIDVMSRPAPRDQPRVPRGDASIPPLAYDGAQDDGLSPAQRLQRQFERAEIERRGSAAAAASEPPPTPSAPDFAAEDFPDLGLAGPETRRQRDAVSAGLDLVPYCTTRAKLNREEVLNLSDLAGGLNDLVILAVGGYVNEEGTDVLDGALGKEVADGIRAFWAEEFLIEL